MHKILAALGLSTALMASAALPLASVADAAIAYSGDGAGVLQDQIAPVEKAQFFWGGNNYCWYPLGWHGPGWYWCGYAWNRGYGWGGGYGWHGWRGGGRGWHGGGGHGGGHYHGGGGHYHH
jgi:hypothetical protein